MGRVILSIDGGGVKNIFSAFILSELEKRLMVLESDKGARLCDYFDLMAGTSSGAVLAAFYLLPEESGRTAFCAEEVLKLFEKFGALTFKRQAGFGLFNAKYSNVYIRQYLNEYLGEKKLSYLKKPCLIPAYDMNTGKAVFFNSVTARKIEKRDYRIQDAVLASCSAPTYFPPVRLVDTDKEEACLIDGGVIANNPALCALIETMKLPHTREISDVTVVSFGNISKKMTYEYEKVKKWGLFQWPGALLDIFMDGSEQTVDYQMRRIFQSYHCPEQYLRIETMIESSPPKLSDFSKTTIKKLEEVAKKYVKDESYQLNQLARMLVAHKRKEKSV